MKIFQILNKFLNNNSISEKMKKIILLLCICAVQTVQSQNVKVYPTPAPMTHDMTEFWTPQPKIVTPGKADCDAAIPAPSDAIILFNGKDLSQWEKANASKVPVQGKDTPKSKSSTDASAKWTLKDGVMIVNKSAGDIQTKLTFGDFQLHIEWRVPEGIQGASQGRGNSGVFLQGVYELQIVDSYNNETYVNGQAGSIYKQAPPLVNAMCKPGEWNVYDVIYTTPTFKEDGTYRTKPYVTILHNGVLVQNNTAIVGTTENVGLPKVIPHGKGPIRLQAHGDKSDPISFRNIWIREL